jgi:hypothetical protein
VYTDNAAAARRLGKLWRRCDAMLAPDPPAGSSRIVCVFSDLRGISACGPTPELADAGDAQEFLAAYRTSGEKAFDTAERLLAAPG